MSGVNRLSGGLVSHDKTVEFQFNNRTYQGLAGDTLASALLANGVRVVGRSFKYHRPRGIFSSGSEEPNALVTLGNEAAAVPNSRATTTELFDSLTAHSQNHLGFLRFDFLAANDLLSPFLGAGFYYKTFMWPKSFWEKLYEPIIRRAAGLGALSKAPDPVKYDKGYLHCDVLIIGAGPTGLAAALAAANSGANVIIADEDFMPGGRLLAEQHQIDDASGSNWASGCWTDLTSMPNVRTMTRTTITGLFDHGEFGALEEISPQNRNDDRPQQIFWRIQSKRTILAAGASERPLIFPGNDRPGIMLAGALQAYANRWAVASGKRVAILTNHDGGDALAEELASTGVTVETVIDARDGSKIVSTTGRMGLKSVQFANGRTIECDALAVSGGWSPNLHLSSHTNGKPVWRDDIQAFVPGDLPKGLQVAGAANGTFGLQDCLDDGDRAGRHAAELCGDEPCNQTHYSTSNASTPPAPIWNLSEGKKRAWVDLQNDVTSKDIKQSHQEGFASVEHLKRYTTLGMSPDQGKTANVAAIALLAEQSGRTIPETGTTRYRPPYVPIPIGALAGREVGKDFQPVRHSPAHEWAETMGASFIETGLWMRPEWFARSGENGWRDSVDREVLAVRNSVGICDVSTLGKIDIRGPDATKLIDFVYCNNFANLPVGKSRYGLMLREDGFVMDDGTTSRLSDTHYMMTTTTGNAGPVYRHLEFAHQCLRPELDVNLVPDTDSWAQFSIAGPNARPLLSRIVDPPFDISNTSFPFMACADLSICKGLPARLFRISFSGELAYEIAVPARFGNSLGATLMEVGADLRITAYGIEALNTLRIEKGHVAGAELAGQTTPTHLGMTRMISTQKDFIGRARHNVVQIDGIEGAELVGVRPIDGTSELLAGAHIHPPTVTANLESDLGWVTSAAYSPTLGHPIGLALIKDGKKRTDERLRAVDILRNLDIEIEVVSPHFFDPDGVRQRG